MYKEKIKKIITLFLMFLKIGAFTFGGGYAMISIIEREVVTKKKWLTKDEYSNLIAIAESTPGVISLNCATYVGAKVANFWGALFASIAVLIPAVIIIVLISIFIGQIEQYNYFKWAFMGIKAGIVALILNAALNFSSILKTQKNILSYIMFAISFILSLLSGLKIIKLDTVYIILFAAFVGIIYGVIKKAKSPPKGNSDNQSTGENNDMDAIK